ncbi:hypothetical protein VaNZ11_015442 [Volvox africanus]|uniref:GATA-type domain-containing protein n=1 Tax=Volvox africanus TaxID=51714 RepID=A0ABQ5SKL2_9CHLO|nr:hypothetical protein VaNZ11_015442 [Volvox africanus]
MQTYILQLCSALYMTHLPFFAPSQGIYVQVTTQWNMRDVKRASSDAQVDELPERRRWTADLRTPSGRASLEIRLPAPIFPATSAICTSAPICPGTQPGDKAARAAGMMPGAVGQPLRRAGSGAPDVVGAAPRLTSFLRSRRLAMPDPSVVAAGISPASLEAPTRQDLAGSNDIAGANTTGAGADNHHNARRSRRRPTVTPAVTAGTAITAFCTKATATRHTDVSFCSGENGSSAAIVVANVQDAAAVTSRGFAAAAKTVSLSARRAAFNQDVQPAMGKRERRGQTRQSIAEKTAAGPTAASASVDEVGPYGSLTDRVAKRTRREVPTGPLQSPTLPQPQQRHPMATRPSRVAAIKLPAKMPAGPALQLPNVFLQRKPPPMPPPMPQMSTKARVCQVLSDVMPMEVSTRQLTQKAVASDPPMLQLLKVPEPQLLSPSAQTKAGLLKETAQQRLLPSGLLLRASPPPAIMYEQPSMPKERAPAATLTLPAVTVVPSMASAAAAPQQGSWAAARLQVPVRSATDQATATATDRKLSAAPAEAAPLPLRVSTALLQDHLALSLETLMALTALSKALQVKEPVAPAPGGVRSPTEVPAAEEGQAAVLATQPQNLTSASELPPKSAVVTLMPSSCVDCGRKAGRTSYRAAEAPGHLACKSCYYRKMALDFDRKRERVIKTDASADAATGRYTATKSEGDWKFSPHTGVPASATTQKEPLLEQKQPIQEANAIPQSSFEPIRIVLWLYASQSAAPPLPLEPLPPRPAPAPASREQEQPTGGEEKDEKEEEEENVMKKCYEEIGDDGDSEEYEDDDDNKGSGGCYRRGGGGGSSLSREAKRQQHLRQQKRLQAHFEKLEKFRRKRRRRERRALKRLVLQPAPGELAALPPPSDFLTNFLLPQPMPLFLPEPTSKAGRRLAEAAKASMAAAAVTEAEAADSVAAIATDDTLTGVAATRVQRMLPQPNSAPCLVCCRIARSVGCVRQDGRYVCRTCCSSTMTWRVSLGADSTGGGGAGNASQAGRAAVASAGSASAATLPDGAGGSGEFSWVPVHRTWPALGAVQLDVEWTGDVVEEAVRLAELMMLVAAHEVGGDRSGSRCGAGSSRGLPGGGKRRRR